MAVDLHQQPTKTYLNKNDISNLQIPWPLLLSVIMHQLSSMASIIVPHYHWILGNQHDKHWNLACVPSTGYSWSFFIQYKALLASRSSVHGIKIL